MKENEIKELLNNEVHRLTRNESHLGSIRIAREYYQQIIIDIYSQSKGIGIVLSEDIEKIIKPEDK